MGGDDWKLASLVALLVGAVLTVSCPSVAHACYSGLVVIPTADLLGPGQYGVDLQCDGTFASGSDETRLVNTEFGLSPRLEAGVDFDLSEGSESRILLNAKYRLTSPDRSHTAVALGVCSVGHGSQGASYVVATHPFGATRGHLGLWRADGDTDWFVGVDRPLTGRFTLYADYTRGPGNVASVGGDYQVSDHYDVTMGAMFPNDGGGTQFTVHFIINGAFTAAGKKQ